jgi:hypothetical protein
LLFSLLPDFLAVWLLSFSTNDRKSAFTGSLAASPSPRHTRGKSQSRGMKCHAY